MLLEPSAASMLSNALIGKRVIRGGEGATRASEFF